MENKNTLKSEQNIKFSWEKIQTEMKEKFGKDIYDSWLRKISFEEEFNIEIPDDIAEKITTIKEAIEHIENSQN